MLLFAEKSCKFDVGFLIDSAASMSDCNYENEKEIVKTIAKNFQVAPEKSQAGIILYSDEAVLQRFKDSQTLTQFKQSVDNLPFKGGKTRLDVGMSLAATRMFKPGNGVRGTNVPKVLFVLTDGVQVSSSIITPLKSSATSLHSRNIKVIVVGAGEAEKSQLSQLVQSPSDIIMVEKFEDAKEKVAKLSDHMCSGLYLIFII